MTMILIVIGLIAGVLAGMFGVGGGLVIVPALVAFLKLDVHSAVGTSLGALLLPVGILGVMEYHRAGFLNIKYAALIAVGLVVGTYIGAKLVQPISPLLLRRLYGAFLLLMSARFLMGR